MPWPNSYGVGGPSGLSGAERRFVAMVIAMPFLAGVAVGVFGCLRWLRLWP
jgi:hypothetical protein